MIFILFPRVISRRFLSFSDGADNVPFASIRFHEGESGAIHIYWNGPKNPNGIILYYVVRYRRLEGKSAPIVAQNGNATESSTTNTIPQVSLLLLPLNGDFGDVVN